jgi:uncharacterized protein YheU (UPF0270 family)
MLTPSPGQAAETLDNIVKSVKVRESLQTTEPVGAMVMKNVYEVLRQKEMELTRLAKEVEALRLVAPLLSEEKEMSSDTVKPVLAAAVNGPQPTPRIPVPSSPSIPAPQPVRAAGWEDTSKRWP